MWSIKITQEKFFNLKCDWKQSHLYIAAQMNSLNIGRNPQNPAVPQVAAPVAAMPEAVPVQNFEEPQVVPNAPPSVQYDLDHDVVMRTPYHYNLTQISEPGFFSGNPN